MSSESTHDTEPCSEEDVVIFHDDQSGFIPVIPDRPKRKEKEITKPKTPNNERFKGIINRLNEIGREIKLEIINGLERRKMRETDEEYDVAIYLLTYQIKNLPNLIK